MEEEPQAPSGVEPSGLVADETSALPVQEAPAVEESAGTEGTGESEGVQGDSFAEAVEAARGGDTAVQERLNSYGIDWQKRPVVRFVSAGEAEHIMNGGRYEGRFGNGNVDVTDRMDGSTGASSEYRVVFKDELDWVTNNRLRMKNADLGDGWLTGGYSLDDVSRIEKRNADGSWETVYDADAAKAGEGECLRFSNKEEGSEEISEEIKKMGDDELDKESVRLSDIINKPNKIDKLKKSMPVKVTPNDYSSKYNLDANSAQKWIKDNLRGEYTIKDTGEKILLSKVGAEEVTSHSRTDLAHIKSVSVIPTMLENAIFLEERPNTKNNGKFDSYRYYAVGMNIDGVDYTAKVVIGVKQGKKYYDHRLTQIEKTKLIDLLNQPASGFTTAGNASLPPYAIGKDSTLNSILQIKPQEITDAQNKLNQISKEKEQRKKKANENDRREDGDMKAVVSETARNLGIEGNVELIEDKSLITDSDKGMERRKRGAYGWFDPKTGKVTIVLGNHTSADQAVKTLLHEAVAHRGLRELCGSNFNTFLDNIYNNVDEKIKAEIDATLGKYKDAREATEEWLARLAERTDFEKIRKSGLWQKIRSWFNEMLLKSGVKLNKPLTDEELRDLLVKSYDRMRKNAEGRSRRLRPLSEFNALDEARRNVEARRLEFMDGEEYGAQGSDHATRLVSDIDRHKNAQNEIIQRANPHNDDLGNHTWIRGIDDVKTYDEALAEDNATTPDFTEEMQQEALRSGRVTVYSSKPIGQGVFVTPSRMEAENYAGEGEVYSKDVPLEDVAWIDSLQGQYAKVDEGKNGESEKLFDYAKKRFGTTNDLRETGYILPDGTMLDFSGRHQVDGDGSFLNGRRTVDHREVANNLNYDENEEDTGFNTSMSDFIDRGAIRINVSSTGYSSINLNNKPTEAQRQVLGRLIRRSDGNVDVDFGNGDNSDYYAEYEGARDAGVLADINRYYDEGIKPGGNVLFSDGEEYKGVEELESVDKFFDKELDDFKNGLHYGLLHLGKPLAILKACGVNVDSLTLSPVVLNRKLNEHNLTTDDLKGLAKAVQRPIMVYNHGLNVPNKVIVTDIMAKGGANCLSVWNWTKTAMSLR